MQTSFARALCSIVVASFLVTASAHAQSSTCFDGVRHDDNTFESGVGWLFGSGQYVMKIDAPGPLEAACICWVRSGNDSSVFFNLKVWAANGPDGGPGTLLGILPNQSATGVGTSASWYRYDLSSLNVVSPGSLYIGPEWDASDDDDFFVCEDTNGPAQQPGYGGNGLASTTAPASKLGRVGFFPDYKTLGVRAKYGTFVPSCTPSATALCLNNGRFRVEASFATAAGQSGPAQMVKLTDATGYLWFFNETNVEAVVKVLDACALNGKFWVFAGGLTNVQVNVTVTDTETGNVKAYSNPQGKAFLPIQDTAALPCN